MNKEALYITIENYILDKIKSGEYKIGDLVPSDRELTELFKTSRSTVNKALFNLTSKGYIYRTPGRGSFVRSAVTKDDLSFQNLVKKTFRVDDLNYIRTENRLLLGDENVIHLGRQDISLDANDFIQKIDCLEKENQMVGVSIITVHTEELSIKEFQEITFSNVFSSRLITDNQYIRRLSINHGSMATEQNNEIFQIDDFDLQNYPVHIELVIEKNQEIRVVLQLYLQVFEFSFTF